jgi:hypothetical protein
MTTYLVTFHNETENMSALVYESNRKQGGFAVALRDDDSGQILAITFHGFRTVEEASAKAKAIANV